MPVPLRTDFAAGELPPPDATTEIRSPLPNGSNRKDRPRTLPAIRQPPGAACRGCSAIQASRGHQTRLSGAAGRAPRPS